MAQPFLSAKRIAVMLWLIVAIILTFHMVARPGTGYQPPHTAGGGEEHSKKHDSVVPQDEKVDDATHQQNEAPRQAVVVKPKSTVEEEDENSAQGNGRGAPWVKPPPFTMPASLAEDNAAPVQCTLSNHAKNTNLASKFLSLCPNFCFPRPEKPNSTVIPHRPSFCSPNKQFKSPQFDFAQKPMDVEVPTRVPLILCALGTRFFGSGGQSYVLETIRQWRLFHSKKQSDVYLIVDKTMLEDHQILNVVDEYHVFLVSSQSLMTDAWRRYWKVFYIQGYMHPGGNRQTGNQKFNQLVSERFFAVQSLMEQRGLEHVIHMENDIMVYGSLVPVVAAAARCGYELASTTPHTKGVIPGVVYIKDHSAMKQLVDFINDLLFCGPKFGKNLQKGYANDMTYLMNYYQYYGSRYLGALPAWEHQQGENCIFEQSRDNAYMFDAASFGQWLSFAKKHNDDEPPLHVRNSMKGRFVDATPGARVKWVVDDHGRKVPHWKQYKLLTLHIHAKNLEYFRSRG